ncbi:UPF0149 family protein [Thioalkalicoccus limnaeus]|uniref:UPF0149 family protein n=1 Tax=Thioalkalicoccus limnaeus TaxID=120681 RepID=A0ABV4BEX4_9GAMM
MTELLADRPISAAEAHGTLCGLLCRKPHEARDDAAGLWLGEVLGNHDEPDSTARDLLIGIAERTQAELTDPDCTLSPLWPADDRPLPERVEAVYDWSRGLVYGLGLAGVEIQRLSPTSREALDDLIAVTHLDLDHLDAGEEPEQALADVAEFVRIAALLLYTECRHGTET